MFRSRGVRNPELVLEGVARCINDETNEKLTVEYSADEIMAALKSMGPTKAPGEDGFPVIFFQKCWHIVGTEITSFGLEITFEPDDADKILRTPLASEAHPDMIFWRGEHSGEFAVRSTYKMLQNQSPTTYPIDSHNTAHSFYKQLWELQLPNKIKILAWKVSWNFIPTMVNLH